MIDFNKVTDIFCIIDDPLINISRVNIRAEIGGHGVPSHKVAESKLPNWFIEFVVNKL